MRDIAAERIEAGGGGEHGRSFATRIALFYGALFLIYAVHVPYLPVWLDFRGLSASDIATITAAPFLVRLAVTPVVALVADRMGNHRQIVIALAWLGLAMALVLSQMQGFWPVATAAVLLALAVTTIMPLTETIAISGVRAAGLDYGRMRLWGSLTFIVFGFLGGMLVDNFGAGIGIWLIAMGAVTTVAAAHLLPGAAAGARKIAAQRLVGDDARRLVSSPLFLIFLLAVGAAQGTHAMFYTFGALEWRAQGLSTAWVGTLWAIGVLAEVVLFATSAVAIERLGAMGLLTMGAAAAVVRWGIMGLDPPLPVLVLLQLLHALTYAASHLGAIQFISRAVPLGAAGTAQALYATVAAGVMMGGATLASGRLYPIYAGRTYFAMALLAAIALSTSVLLARRWDGGALWGQGGAG